MEPRMDADARSPDSSRTGSNASPSACIRVHLRFLLLGALLVGCSPNKSKPTTRPMTAAERQDAALRDPFGYSPNIEKSSGGSGGDWGKYDREGMRKDIDHVLNP
jgi:hypothetical protein